MHEDEINAKPAQTPIVTPPTPQPKATDQPNNSAGLIVLQWLTYAFWGWTVLATIILIAILTLTQLSGNSEDVSRPVIYGITAAFILLIISIVCELLYTKYEPKEKHGAASVVLVVHAVLFAMLGIAGLIVAVFSLVNMLINDFSSDGAMTSLISGSAAIVLYALLFIRTVRPFVFKKYSYVLALIMTLVVIGVAAWGVAGPVVSSQTLRNDRAVQRVLRDITQEISTSTDTEGKLPTDLQQIVRQANIDNDTVSEEKLTELIDDKKITYTPNTLAPKKSTTAGNTQNTVHYYEICATYDHTVKNSSRSSSERKDSDGYISYLPLTDIKEGKQCYKIKVNTYNPYQPESSQQLPIPDAYLRQG